MTMSLLEEYTRLYREVLRPVAVGLEGLIRDHLASTRRVDRVAARAKAPDPFIAKASKQEPDGSPKYVDPLVQIQDQIGARIVVFYKPDVETVSGIVKRYFRPIELQTIVPDSHWTFGYFGMHFILALPTEAVPAGIAVDRAPQFFELQIKTLFEHAWSEAEHDLGYKPPEQLNGDQQRRLAYTAAQAWGADRVFEELHKEVGAIGSV